MKSVIKFLIKKFQLLILVFSYNITSKKDTKKIIIGVTEISNVLYNMKLIFNKECIIVCKNRNRMYTNNQYDIDISRNKISKLLIAPMILGILAKNACFFIYFWTNGFMFDREDDFKFLKKHNIPIVCLFLGDDIRSRKLQNEYCKKIDFSMPFEYEKDGFTLTEKYDNLKKLVAEQADKYAKIIFSHPVDQMSYLHSTQYFFPPIINEQLFSFKEEKFNKLPIKIIHAPSSPVLKGTPVIRSVIKMLKNEGYEFRYTELINCQNEEIIDELNNSHVVINQLYSFFPGIFGLEAMATGNAVLMSAKAYFSPYSFNNAWIETEDWQLYYNLKYLLNNHQKIIEYARNGYEYIVNNYNIKAIKRYLFSIFEENDISIQ